MRPAYPALRALFVPAVAVSVLAAAATATPVTAPVLDTYGTSLTDYKAANKTVVQDLRPRFDQRGVDIDGTLKSYAPLGWSIAADNLGGGYSSGRTLGDVNLFTGSYNPTDIDLALPTLGLPVVIGRTFNSVQEYSASRYDSDGYQGWNWAQTVQPEIRMYEPGGADNMIYLVYGADRYIEFKRTGSSDTEYKAKNGAAGVIEFAAGASTEPDTYTYIDQRGNRIVFFGFDGDSGAATGQMWKMIDPAGNTAYVGDATTGSTAISSGFVSTTGRVSTMYDASGRKYLFTYNTFGSKTRLQTVEAQQYISSSWTTVAQVDYDYYTSTDDTNDKGLAGDLRLVTITMKGTAGSDYIRRKYYRYYTRAWNNSDGRRGQAHYLKMVVGFEGTRAYDFSDTSFDQDYYGETDANLMPYSESYFEYGNGESRIQYVTINGNCGCGGGTSGVTLLGYADSSGYSAGVSGTTYTSGWGRRTAFREPSGLYGSQYFDETGAVLGRVTANGTLTGSPTKTWVTDVERNSSGQVTAIHSPANVDTYTHSTGVITYEPGAGLITTYARRNNSDNLDGLLESVSVKEGTGGSEVMVSAITLEERQLVTAYTGISVPVVTEGKTYPVGGGGALTTAYSNDGTYDWWSATNTLPAYIARKRIITTHPTVSTGNHGSNSGTANMRCLRADGSTAFTVDAGGIVFYSGQDGFGRVVTRIADADTGGSFSPDTVASWQSLASGGTEIGATTTYTYDNQGRVLTVTQPAVGTGYGGSTRVSAMKYGVLGDGRMYTMSSPRYATNYYGPISYSLVNNAGRGVRQAMIKVDSPSGSFPGTTPGSDWSGMVDTLYDSSGMRATSTRTYTTDSSTYDTASYGYDDMGRREKVADATGTITRTVFDERGLPVERWVGTDDTDFPSGSGGFDMTKVEEMVYDGGSGGGNGLLTSRVQDEDGAWGAGTVRTTTIAYDFRNRAVLTANPAAPHTLVKYDNMNRVIAAAQYNDTTGLSASSDPTTVETANSDATIRLALSETAFDEKGQVYQTVRWNINQTDGTAGDGLHTDNWYDGDGRLIKTVGRQIIKTTHDRLGRVLGRYVIAQTDDGSSYGDALLVGADDTVVEESHTVYDPPSGRPVMQFSVQRAHDDDLGGTAGQLDPAADAGALAVDPTAISGRVQISAVWYDLWDRVTDVVNVGTNGGTAFDRTDAIASRGDSYLRTTTAYDNFGRVWKVNDIEDIETRTTYDFAGRRSRVVENYEDNVIDSGEDDKDRITDYVYMSGSRLETVTRRMPSSEDQVTTYDYDTIKGVDDSQVSDKRLLHMTILPPQYETPGVQTEVDRRTLYAYNAIGEVIVTTDPGENVILTEHDLMGRVTKRTVDAFGPGFDAGVDWIEYVYTPRGQLESVKQWNAGPDEFTNEVKFEYDGWGNVQYHRLDPDSELGGGGRDPFVTQYAYQFSGDALSTPRWVQMAEWVAPSLDMTYKANPVSNIDGQLGRTGEILGNDVGMVGYSYLGASTVVGVTHPEPMLFNRSYEEGLSELGGVGYDDHLDRFNRPKTNRWTKDLDETPLNPVFLDLGMTYNRYGQPLTVQDNVLKDGSSNRNFDQENAYDDLRRLQERIEGELDSPPTSIITQSRLQMLLRDLGGRTVQDCVSLNDDADYTDGPPNAIDAGEMDDTRTLNKRDELRSREVLDFDDDGPPRTVILDYDRNGNLTDDGEKYKYVYNPFGQLVQITLQNDDPIAMYTYNGLGQRISEQTDTNDSGLGGSPDGIADGYDSVFYLALDLQGRRVGTWRGGDTYPKETFLWHPAGMSGPAFKGGVILRDRDGILAAPHEWEKDAASDVRDQRHYYCSDFRGDVAALVQVSELETGGVLAEQCRYSATGIPIGIPAGDFDANGMADYSAFSGADDDIWNVIAASSYQTRGDANLDGIVDSSDQDILIANDGITLGRGRLSAPAVSSRVGYGNMEAFGEGFNTLTYYTGARGIRWLGMAWNVMQTDGPSGLIRPIRTRPTPRELPITDPICQTICSGPDETSGRIPMGGTTCLGKTPVYCICPTTTYPIWYNDPGAQSALQDCNRIHERVHAECQANCKNCPDGQQCHPSGEPDADLSQRHACNEAEAYHAEKLCLLLKLADKCANNPPEGTSYYDCLFQVLSRWIEADNLYEHYRSLCKRRGTLEYFRKRLFRPDDFGDGSEVMGPCAGNVVFLMN